MTASGDGLRGGDRGRRRGRLRRRRRRPTAWRSPARSPTAITTTPITAGSTLRRRSIEPHRVELDAHPPIVARVARTRFRQADHGTDRASIRARVPSADDSSRILGRPGIPPAGRHLRVHELHGRCRGRPRRRLQRRHPARLRAARRTARFGHGGRPARIQHRQARGRRRLRASPRPSTLDGHGDALLDQLQAVYRSFVVRRSEASTDGGSRLRGVLGRRRSRPEDGPPPRSGRSARRSGRTPNCSVPR